MILRRPTFWLWFLLALALADDYFFFEEDYPTDSPSDDGHFHVGLRRPQRTSPRRQRHYGGRSRPYHSSSYSSSPSSGHRGYYGREIGGGGGGKGSTRVVDGKGEKRIRFSEMEMSDSC